MDHESEINIYTKVTIQNLLRNLTGNYFSGQLTFQFKYK